MPGPLLGKDSLVALLDAVLILWRIVEDCGGFWSSYPLSLVRFYPITNSFEALSVGIPRGIPSSLLHIPFPQFHFSHPAST